jgi:hypothetical protein
MFFPVLVAAILSCSTNAHCPPGSFKNLKILVISAYGCANELDLDSSGLGSWKSGSASGGYDKKADHLDSIFTVDKLSVGKKRDLDSLKNYISSLFKMKEIKHSMQRDTYHFELFIDGVQKVDMYGNNKQVYHILHILIKYFPPKLKDRCEFLRLFKSINEEAR